MRPLARFLAKARLPATCAETAASRYRAASSISSIGSRKQLLASASGGVPPTAQTRRAVGEARRQRRKSRCTIARPPSPVSSRSVTSLRWLGHEGGHRSEHAVRPDQGVLQGVRGRASGAGRRQGRRAARCGEHALAAPHARVALDREGGSGGCGAADPRACLALDDHGLRDNRAEAAHEGDGGFS